MSYPVRPLSSIAAASVALDAGAHHLLTRALRTAGRNA